MVSAATYQPAKRQRAVPQKRIVDPAGWTAADFREAGPWVLQIPEDAIADVLAAVDRAEKGGVDLTRMKREDFPVGAAAVRLFKTMRETLLEGVGFVQVRGLPVARMTRRQAALAFLGIGTHLGMRVPQNEDGHVLGHVKDIGAEVGKLTTRNYQTSQAIGFHSDSCDLVALMCLKTAESGGESRIVSSINIYNTMLERRPDLLAELSTEFYWSRHGKYENGTIPWYKVPPFAFVDGYFSCRGLSVRLDKAQKLPDVPPLTPKQQEAIKMFRTLTAELSVDIPFVEGDFQILCNHVILHSRRPYKDFADPAEKRHLLRLWLNDELVRPVPSYVREDFRGVEIASGGLLSAPLEVEVLV
jgi:hypothetical protein